MLRTVVPAAELSIRTWKTTVEVLAATSWPRRGGACVATDAGPNGPRGGDVFCLVVPGRVRLGPLPATRGVTDGAGDERGVGRDHVGRDRVDGRLVAGVAERQGVFEDVARLGRGVSRQVGDRLAALDGGGEQVDLGGEGGGVVEVAGRGEPDVRRGGAVGKHTGSVDDLRVDAEVVDGGGVAVGEVVAVGGDAAAEEVGRRALGISEPGAADLEVVTRDPVVALVGDGAELGAHAAGLGSEEARDGGVDDLGARHPGVAREDGEVAQRRGGVLEGDDEAPAPVAVAAGGSGDVGSPVGAGTGALDDAGDVAIGGVVVGAARLVVHRAGAQRRVARVPGRPELDVADGAGGSGATGSGRTGGSPEEAGVEDPGAGRDGDVRRRGAGGAGVGVGVEERHDEVVVAAGGGAALDLRARRRRAARQDGVARDLKRPVGLRREDRSERAEDLGLGRRGGQRDHRSKSDDDERHRRQAVQQLPAAMCLDASCPHPCHGAPVPIGSGGKRDPGRTRPDTPGSPITRGQGRGYG